MALLTDKETEKELSDRLSEFSQFGMVFNYMLDIDKIDIDDLEKMFFDTDQEKVTFIYSKLIKKIKSNYMESSYTIYSHEYPNSSNLNNNDYCDYLNKCCINRIISRVEKKIKRVDKTFINTYNYLLEKENKGFIRK